MQAPNARNSVSAEAQQHKGNEDSGLASLVVIAQLAGVPLSVDRLRHLSGLQGHVDTLTLVRLARQASLKARSTNSSVARLAQTPLPAIAEMLDGRYLVVAKCSDENVLLHDEVNQRTFQVSLIEFEQHWSGRLILVTSRAVLAKAGSRFGLVCF